LRREDINKLGKAAFDRKNWLAFGNLPTWVLYRPPDSKLQMPIQLDQFCDLSKVWRNRAQHPRHVHQGAVHGVNFPCSPVIPLLQAPHPIVPASGGVGGGGGVRVPCTGKHRC